VRFTDCRGQADVPPRTLLPSPRWSSLINLNSASAAELEKLPAWDRPWLRASSEYRQKSGGLQEDRGADERQGHRREVVPQDETAGDVARSRSVRPMRASRRRRRRVVCGVGDGDATAGDTCRPGDSGYRSGHRRGRARQAAGFIARPASAGPSTRAVPYGGDWVGCSIWIEGRLDLSVCQDGKQERHPQSRRRRRSSTRVTKDRTTSRRVFPGVSRSPVDGTAARPKATRRLLTRSGSDRSNIASFSYSDVVPRARLSAVLFERNQYAGAGSATFPGRHEVAEVRSRSTRKWLPA
jgi:hypothetical protein